MTVVARTSRFITGFAAVLALPIVARAFLAPTRWSFLWAVMALLVVHRVSQIKVGVTKEFVRIQNFFRTIDVPVWEAEIELGEPEPGIGLSDAGGKYDEGGRMLYIRRSWHQDRVHIGIAPRFGEEAHRIRIDLEDEIKKARAA